MQVFIAATLVLSSYTVSAGDIPTHYPQYVRYKSFPTALTECAVYYEVSSCFLDHIVRASFPNEREVKKLVRCALLNLRCWDDATGVQEQVMNYFFNPIPEDTCFLNRTRECINNPQLQPERSSDVETRAYNAFVCYYRQYGTLNEINQFLPLLPKEYAQLVLTSLSLANVSKEALKQFSRGNILNRPQFLDVLLIIFIRGGFFQGSLLRKHLYIQFGDPEILTPQMEQCVDASINMLPCYADEKAQVYRIFRNCLQDTTDMLSVVHRLSKELLAIKLPVTSLILNEEVCHKLLVTMQHALSLILSGDD